ncbi:peptidoglycan-binding domain-containing protein [Micromonospora sp. WMMD964]|uniref:peptidoglycan-binding domain-containing protein n=1 Tax=Micromonospora sp. WMMD964 TaxID=3016091 RepID=UPI00249C2D6A|nr:peptidoglycan-binding domain-containing protein [Micromonospora sp. WMMD964]WFF00742.1 peptidoglycan-binding domain-containing protein [Micromonospora sp. WMMD964]
MLLESAKAILAATVVGTLIVSAAPAPASASIGSGFVDGSGDWTNDWENEGPIGMGSYSRNNVVAMWQQILWAEGYLAGFDIDCVFGPVTAAATRAFQDVNGLFITGRADPDSFKYVSRWLQEGSAPGKYRYIGIESRRIDFNRQSSGIWNMYIGGDLHNLSYTYANFDVCD